MDGTQPEQAKESINLQRLDSDSLEVCSSYFQVSRPKGIVEIQQPLRLASEFALAVTALDATRQGWIAKNGPNSLFSLLSRIFPQVLFTFSNEIPSI